MTATMAEQDPTRGGAEVPIVSVGADVDVVKLVDEIRAEVTRKAAAGLYLPEPMLDIEAAAADPLDTRLLALRDAASFSTEPPTISSRRRLAGAVSVAKRVIALALRWHTCWLVGQLHTFASNAVLATSSVVRRLHEQEAALATLEQRLARLETPLEQTVPHVGPAVLDADCEPGGLAALAAAAPASLGAVFACRLLLGMDEAAARDVLELASRALVVGGLLRLEFPSCRLPEVTLASLARSAGLHEVEVRRQYHRVPTDPHLRPLPAGNPAFADLRAVLEENFRRIDEMLFGPGTVVLLARR